MRNYFPSIIGNIALRRRIGDAVTAGTLSHAYIIEGAAGSGKRTFARHIAASIACTASHDAPLPCGVCPHCRRILGGMSPDVRMIEPTGTTISVDAIRDARADMYLSSTEEEVKVYIIDHAEAMTVQAQNALLIVLEEPPTNLLILLLTDRADTLLPTIRSRAALLRMSLLTPAEMEAALCDNHDAQTLRTRSPETYEALLENASGCLGSMLDMLDGKKNTELMKMRAFVADVVDEMLSGNPFSALYEKIQDLPTKRAELIPHLDMIASALRDLILLRGDETAPLVFYTSRPDAVILSEKASTGRLLTLYDAIREAITSLSQNANVNLTITSLTSRIK